MNRLSNALGQMSRATAGPIVVRVIVGFAAFAGMQLALPRPLLSIEGTIFLFGLSALTAVFVSGPLVTAVMLGTLVSWLVATTVGGEPVEPSRLFGLACALYVLQTASSLACALPYDAIVDNQVFLRWVARSAMVLIAAAGLVFLVGTLVPELTPQPSALIVVGGLGACAATVALLARLSRRA